MDAQAIFPSGADNVIAEKASLSLYHTIGDNEVLLESFAVASAVKANVSSIEAVSNIFELIVELRETLTYETTHTQQTKA